MLKVVGASWVQIRISTCIITFVFVLGLIAIILTELARKDPNGIYAATTYWKEESGFYTEYWGQGNDLKSLPKGAARAYYKPFNNQTGWAVLEIETQPEYPDWVQAYAAGMLEGSLTWQMIYWHWQNTVRDACVGRERYCQKVRDFLTVNNQWTRHQAEDNELDPYWRQVRLFYYQLDGLQHGFRIGVENSRQEIQLEEMDFLWMNVASDLLDFEYKYDGVKPDYDDSKTERHSLNDIVEKKKLYRRSVEQDDSRRQHSTTRWSCTSSALVKLSKELKQLYIAHNSAFEYSSMLKILKRYELHYHMGLEVSSEQIPGTSVSFSSYPAALHSMDDFYIVTNDDDNLHLAIAGSAITNFNPQLWDQVAPKNQTLLGLRAMAANRLSENPQSWTENLSKYNSGTGNKEWLIIDLHKFESLKHSQHFIQQLDNTTDLLWVAEQIPQHFVAQDQTKKLVEQSYWSTYGLPFYKEIFDLSETDSMESKYGSDFSYLESTVAKIFRRDVDQAGNLVLVAKLMRSNNYTQDPFSVGDPIKAVASRGDILTPTHPQVPLGVTDVKIYTSKIETTPTTNGHPKLTVAPTVTEENVFVGVIGPTYNYEAGVEPFSWSGSNFNELSHVGQPDVWQFPPLYHTWQWGS